MFFKGIEKGRNDTEAGKKKLSIKKNSNQCNQLNFQLKRIQISERKKEILNVTQ